MKTVDDRENKAWDMINADDTSEVNNESCKDNIDILGEASVMNNAARYNMDLNKMSIHCYIYIINGSVYNKRRSDLVGIFGYLLIGQLIKDLHA